MEPPPLEEPGTPAEDEFPGVDDDDTGGWDVVVLPPLEDAAALDPDCDVEPGVVLVPDAPADETDAVPLVPAPLEDAPAVPPPLPVAPEASEAPVVEDVAVSRDDGTTVPEEDVPTAPLEAPPVARQNPPSQRSLTRQSDAPVLHTRLQVSPSYAWSSGQLAVLPQASSNVVTQTSGRTRAIMGSSTPFRTRGVNP